MYSAYMWSEGRHAPAANHHQSNKTVVGIGLPFGLGHVWFDIELPALNDKPISSMAQMNNENLKPLLTSAPNACRSERVQLSELVLTSQVCQLIDRELSIKRE